MQKQRNIIKRLPTSKNAAKKIRTERPKGGYWYLTLCPHYIVHTDIDLHNSLIIYYLNLAKNGGELKMNSRTAGFSVRSRCQKKCTRSKPAVSYSGCQFAIMQDLRDAGIDEAAAAALLQTAQQSIEQEESVKVMTQEEIVEAQTELWKKLLTEQGLYTESGTDCGKIID